MPTDYAFDVFLSYARADDELFVRKLYERLTAKDLTVWYDHKKMTNSGGEFPQHLTNSVLASKRLLLILGPNALTSDYVTKEWQTAFNANTGIPIIPLLRGVDLADLPPKLTKIDTLDFSDDAQFEHKLNYLLRQINEAVAPLGDLHGIS
ncbi:MAG: toll/interleukin-1 receptor domain-containing protein, partial [Armatimonadetes bacterium]|nr:toll/interleukin-1 receptor domain-containing protein [Anaerolineae bacterium]